MAVERSPEYFTQTYNVNNEIWQKQVEGFAYGRLVGMLQQEHNRMFKKLWDKPWFHPEKMSVETRGGKFHITTEAITEIPENHDKEIVDFLAYVIEEYLKNVVKSIKRTVAQTGKVERELIIASSLDDFIVGLKKKRKLGDPDAFV